MGSLCERGVIRIASLRRIAALSSSFTPEWEAEVFGFMEIAVAFIGLMVAYAYAWRIYRGAWDNRAAPELEWELSKDEWRARALARLRRRRHALERMGRPSVDSRRSAELLGDAYSTGWVERH